MALGLPAGTCPSHASPRHVSRDVSRSPGARSRVQSCRVVRCAAFHRKGGQEDSGRASGRYTAGEALMQSLSEVHRSSNRNSLGCNIVLGTDNSEESWRLVDKHVNTYPGQRTFTAVGTGGESFTRAMVTAVSSVVGHVAEEQVAEKRSSKGTYVSITVGPVWVKTADDVIAVYTNMRGDKRLRWFL